MTYRPRRVLKNPVQRGSHASPQRSDQVVCQPANPARFVFQHPPREKAFSTAGLGIVAYRQKRSSLAERALVLNATYEPLSIVSARRAVVLVLRAKADTVATADQLWRSAERTFEVPSVVRLRNYVKVPYHRRVPLTRTAVFARDSHRCQYCRAPAESLDHVVPKATAVNMPGRTWWHAAVAAISAKGTGFPTRQASSSPERPSPRAIRDGCTQPWVSHATRGGFPTCWPSRHNRARWRPGNGTDRVRFPRIHTLPGVRQWP